MADSPKGKPIFLQSIEHVEAISINSANSNISIEHGLLYYMLPSMFSSMLVIHMARKTQFYLLDDPDEAAVWVNSLRQAKQETITRSMGHSRIPYPKTLSYFDKLASEYNKKKFEIKKRIERLENREMEMSSLVNQGFYSPRASID